MKLFKQPEDQIMEIDLSAGKIYIKGMPEIAIHAYNALIDKLNSYTGKEYEAGGTTSCGFHITNGDCEDEDLEKEPTA